MKNIILFWGLFFSIFGWGSEKIIIVSRASSLDSITVTEYFVNEGRMRLQKKYGPLGYVLLKNSTLVLYSWNKEFENYEMKIDRLGDWEFDFDTLLLGGGGAFPNLDCYVVWDKNDIEIDCDNAKRDFFLMDLRAKKCISVSTDEELSKNLSQELKDLKVLYYDANPRGAGVKKHSVLLNVFDLRNRKVRTIREFPELSDDYKVGMEYPLWGVAQWLSSEIISYMTLERTTNDTNILRLYTSYLKSPSETILLASFEFPYSIDGLDYQIFNNKVYVKNIDGIYVLTEDNIANEIYRQNNGHILGFWVEN